MAAGEREDLVAQIKQISGRTGGRWTILVTGLAWGIGRVAAGQDLVDLADAVPTELVDHLARDARQQGRVGSAQQVEDNGPLGAAGAVGLLLFVEDGLELFGRQG